MEHLSDCSRNVPIESFKELIPVILSYTMLVELCALAFRCCGHVGVLNQMEKVLPLFPVFFLRRLFTHKHHTPKSCPK